MKISVLCSAFGKRIHEIVVTKSNASDGNLLDRHIIYSEMCENPQRSWKLLGDKAYTGKKFHGNVVASQPETSGDTSMNHEIGKKRYSVECHIGDLARWVVFRGDSRYKKSFYDDHHGNRLQICVGLQNLLYELRNQYI